MNGVLILGCGYSGLRLAQRLSVRGIPVWGTTRKEERFEAISASGATPLLYEPGTVDLPASILTQVDTVVDSVGPSWATGDDVTPAIVEALAGTTLERFVYLSSTSVYGQQHGDWTDEETPCSPSAPAGIRRLGIERFLHESSLPVLVARIPGIYGEERSTIHRLRSGRFRLIEGNDAFSNRIHVRDLARGLEAMCDRGVVGSTYLICDDQPTVMSEVAQYCRELLGDISYPVLSWEEARASLKPSHIAMIEDSKRLRNTRMRRDLGVELEFPTYREGLRQVAEHHGWVV